MLRKYFYLLPRLQLFTFALRVVELLEIIRSMKRPMRTFQHSDKRELEVKICRYLPEVNLYIATDPPKIFKHVVGHTTQSSAEIGDTFPRLIRLPV